MRVNYRTKKKLHYLTVPEYGEKNGRLHYHSLFFNFEYLPQVYDELTKLWGHGHILFKSVKDDKVMFYLTKYVSKDQKEANQKTFFTSKNIKRPKQVYNLPVEIFKDKKLIGNNFFANEFNSGVKYHFQTT